MKALWNRLSVGGKLCLFVIAAYFLCAAWGGVRSLRARLADETPAYNVVNAAERYLPPAPGHVLGTDNLGRSVALRLVQGARIAGKAWNSPETYYTFRGKVVSGAEIDPVRVQAGTKVWTKK